MHIVNRRYQHRRRSRPSQLWYLQGDRHELQLPVVPQSHPRPSRWNLGAYSKIFWHGFVFREHSVRIWRRSSKGHSGAEVVSTGFAARASPTGMAWLNGNMVPYFERRYFWASFVNSSWCLVTHDKGPWRVYLDNDPSMGPEIYLKRCESTW